MRQRGEARDWVAKSPASITFNPRLDARLGTHRCDHGCICVHTPHHRLRSVGGSCNRGSAHRSSGAVVRFQRFLPASAVLKFPVSRTRRAMACFSSHRAQGARAVRTRRFRQAQPHGLELHAARYNRSTLIEVFPDDVEQLQALFEHGVAPLIQIVRVYIPGEFSVEDRVDEWTRFFRELRGTVRQYGGNAEIWVQRTHRI